MENLLIVLVFVASIVYKIYSNYKEEMAKSAKRTPQRQPHQQNSDNRPLSPAHRQQSTPPPIPKIVQQQAANPFVTKSNIIQDIPEEVQRAKQNRKAKPIERQDRPENEGQLERQPISFDLRQAVIQSAILDRPYK